VRAMARAKTRDAKNRGLGTPRAAENRDGGKKNTSRNRKYGARTGTPGGQISGEQRTDQGRTSAERLQIQSEKLSQTGESWVCRPAEQPRQTADNYWRRGPAAGNRRRRGTDTLTWCHGRMENLSSNLAPVHCRD
jgi:hypothetical protein